VCFEARLLPYAVRNGLRNAARHAHGRISLSAWREGDDVLVAVDDDGEGIPPPQREAVFQPFRRRTAHATAPAAASAWAWPSWRA
jgi:two-component system sensor histidine kinase RstB